MIGMMNVGQTDGVEFYGSARQNSLFDNRKISSAKDLRGYMADGRVMLNGVPVITEKPEDLWQGLIQKAVAKNMVDHVVEKPGRIASILRRLSSKFSSFSKKQEKKEEENVVELADLDEAFHITRIRIHTQHPPKPNPQDVEDQTILNKLMREKAAIERNQWHSNSKETDSGRASLDDFQDHKVVIAVERM